MFTMLEPKKLGLDGDNWLIVCFVNGISNSDYHWIVHDKDPKSSEETIEIVLHYQPLRTSKKDHNKPKVRGTKQSQFTGKYQTPNKFLDCNFK